MSRFKSLLLSASLLAGLLGFAGAAFAEAPNADIRSGMQTPPPTDQRMALVIGNANYQTAPKLANPGNDAQSMSQLLNSAGFEVTKAIDLTRNDMVRVVQDFTAKVAERGPGTVAMIYYAGHGVQIEGENYLLPVDAKISSAYDLDGNSLRLVDLMGTLDAITSRMRIVVLDACRNNPFPEISDAGRGLAIVDAPNGSIVGYSTSPGMEAADGDGNHSPYTSAFINNAREPNLPIEQLFKRVRLDVNHATRGRHGRIAEEKEIGGQRRAFPRRLTAPGRVVHFEPDALEQLLDRQVRLARDVEERGRIRAVVAVAIRRFHARCG